jgi:hypothetical protein
MISVLASLVEERGRAGGRGMNMIGTVMGAAKGMPHILL